jgi:hypothetical protein
MTSTPAEPDELDTHPDDLPADQAPSVEEADLSGDPIPDDDEAPS